MILPFEKPKKKLQIVKDIKKKSQEIQKKILEFLKDKTYEHTKAKNR